MTKVTYQQTPKVLEVHGGDVVVDLKGTFPEKYFAKKFIVEITPTIISETGEENKLKSIILQGEQEQGVMKLYFLNQVVLLFILIK